jgi:hypothetical protein
MKQEKGEESNTWKDYEREPGRRGSQRRDHQRRPRRRVHQKRPERRDHEGAREEGPPKKAKEQGPPKKAGEEGPPKKAREEGPPKRGSWMQGPPKRKVLLLSRRRDEESKRVRSRTSAKNFQTPSSHGCTLSKHSDQLDIAKYCNSSNCLSIFIYRRSLLRPSCILTSYL